MSAQPKFFSGTWAIVITPAGSDEIRSEDGSVLICELPYGATEGVEAANARLIAAAPDLYKGCRLALNAFERGDAIDWNMLSAALAKADGP